MMIAPLDVIWLPDTTARGVRKTRMMVCLVPDEGFFVRINSDKRHVPNARLLKEPYHPFLDHDSYVECNLLVVSDDWIEDAIRERGIVGKLDSSMVEPILASLSNSAYVRKSDFAIIWRVLNPT